MPRIPVYDFQVGVACLMKPQRRVRRYTDWFMPKPNRAGRHAIAAYFVQLTRSRREFLNIESDLPAAIE